MIEGITTDVETKASNAATTLAGDMDAFLLLLTTQLKNQDPLSPLEPTEFTGQLVQFASVEQQISTNDHLEKLLLVENASLASAVVGFIGTEVVGDFGGNLPLQDGEAKFEYTLTNSASNVLITVTDSKGKVMFTKAGERTAGTHEVVWDGKDVNGLAVPDGAYSLSVKPIAHEGSTVDVDTRIYAKVTGVSMVNGTTLEAGGTSIKLDKVDTVTEGKQ
ncbi:MAG: flagellar hook capping FlgD N-terminal domain-containing protein [Rhodospirillales bacterium]|nr:flagellar hook capping FlgD N-terminal domain-containing protein [Rhodospirillales bacterium]